MEPIGVSLEGEWSSLSGMYRSEEAVFLAQLLGNNDSSSCFGVPSSFWSSHDSEMNMAAVNEDSVDTNFYNFSQGSSCYSGGSNFLFATSSQESYFLNDSHAVLVSNNSSMSMDFCVGDVINTVSYLVEGDDCLNQEISNGNVEEYGGNQQPEAADFPDKQEMLVPEQLTEDKSGKPPEISKKRSRNAGDAQKNKRNARSKKSQKLASGNNNAEECNAGVNVPATSSCCSEDDSNGSHELNGGANSSLSLKGTPALNLNGRTRASRGAATDPQSLYARKRRERINERLKILQNLVPNGTKVDISTMLEEAVNYVKFLQLQIKLLSSDDLWMYAPIAYNGMDIGLDLKLSTAR
ncbi:hypothetical protein MANES_10G083200v8 [Manihot esculenta]|uniref:BHLH domain-containing protein n=1 Tax=Manihot esculenta TaxID=3983 RepID=A0A2C9V4L6_MANES|nr:hypothetical protein MANES_10G083200v8 [Manihot esculenta]